MPLVLLLLVLLLLLFWLRTDTPMTASAAKDNMMTNSLYMLVFILGLQVLQSCC